jgi:hypothetical protein
MSSKEPEHRKCCGAGIAGHYYDGSIFSIAERNGIGQIDSILLLNSNADLVKKNQS